MRSFIKALFLCGMSIAVVLSGGGGLDAVQAADRPPVSGEGLRHEEIKSYLLEYPEIITEALEVLRHSTRHKLIVMPRMTHNKRSGWFKQAE